MYFLFLLQHKGIPIYDIFDKNIKELPTTRFSADVDDHYKEIYFEQRKKLMRQGRLPRYSSVSEKAKKENHFEETRLDVTGLGQSMNTTESYFPIQTGPYPMPKRPNNVPSLNLKKVEIIQQERLRQ